MFQDCFQITSREPHYRISVGFIIFLHVFLFRVKFKHVVENLLFSYNNNTTVVAQYINAIVKFLMYVMVTESVLGAGRVRDVGHGVSPLTSGTFCSCDHLGTCSCAGLASASRGTQTSLPTAPSDTNYGQSQTCIQCLHN